MWLEHPIVTTWSSIRRTIPLIVLIPMLLGIFFTWYLTNHQHKTTLQEIIVQFHNDTNEQLQEEITTLVQEPQKIINANSIKIRRDQLNINQDIGSSEWRDIFLSQLFLHSSIHSIAYQNTDKFFVSVERKNQQIAFTTTQQVLGANPTSLTAGEHTDTSQKPMSVLIDQHSWKDIPESITAQNIPSLPDWYQQGLSNPNTAIWTVEQNNSQPMLQVIQPILNNNEILGVLLIQQSMTEYHKLLQYFDFRGPGEALIISTTAHPSGVLSISNKTHTFNPTSRIFEKKIDHFSFDEAFYTAFNESNIVVNDIEDGQSKMITFVHNKLSIRAQISPLSTPLQKPWYTVVIMPRQMFLQNHSSNRNSTALLVLTGLLLATWIGIRMSRRIVEPVISLSNAAIGIQTQTFDPKDVGVIAQRNDEFGALARSFNEMATVLIAREQDLQQLVEQRTRQIQEQHMEIQKKNEENEHLLLNILPRPVARRLKDGEHNISDSFAMTSVLFADLVGFTKFSSSMSSSDLVTLLNQVFSGFDHLCLQYGVEKIKTIGDGYLVASGLPKPREDHAQALVVVAMEMLKYLDKYSEENNCRLQLRVGIHSGPVTAGVIGTHKFIYDLWGDTVNIASRMESHGMPGRVHVSETTQELIQESFALETRQPIEVKGKGIMQTFWIKEAREGVLLPQASQSVLSQYNSSALLLENDINAESSWGDILNSKVSLRSLRALLTKDLFSKENEAQNPDQTKIQLTPEELHNMDWKELLSQDVTLQSLKTLFTKDLRNKK